MGYNLLIGEFEPVIYEGERYARGGCTVLSGAEGAPLDPKGCGVRDSQNWPSYSAWEQFTAAVGLHAVFFAGTQQQGRVKVPYWTDRSGNCHEGLIRTHPGAQALTAEHLHQFKLAAARLAEQPAQERWIYRNTGTELDGKCGLSVRLDWLIFWTEYALKNCTLPTFANS